MKERLVRKERKVKKKGIKRMEDKESKDVNETKVKKDKQ